MANDTYVPDNGNRDRLRVNLNVRNRAINGGTTREWLGVFGLITTDEQPAGYVPMERKPEPRRVENR
jgi:hypothetical protein